MIGMFIGAPALFIVSQTSWLALAIMGLAIFGMMRAFSDSNLMPALCVVADPRYRATGYGLLNMFFCALGGLAILAGGSLRDSGISVRRLFQFAAGAMILAGFLLMLVKPRHGLVPSSGRPAADRNPRSRAAGL